MNKHTPGPWQYKRTSGFDYGSTAYWVPGICVNIDKEANARLIAAAPDLLAVVKELKESAAYWSEYDVPIGIVDRINAAIAKAEES